MCVWIYVNELCSSFFLSLSLNNDNLESGPWR